MFRPLKTLVSFLSCLILLMISSSGWAQPAAGTTPQVLPQTTRDAFSACLLACRKQRPMCIMPGKADIAKECAGVAECGNLTSGETAELNAWADACMQNLTPLCPGSCQPSGQTAPPAGGSGATPAVIPPSPKKSPATFDERCRARGGVPTTISADGKDQRVCYTLKYAYEEVQTLKRQLAETQTQIRAFQDRSDAVPASLLQTFDERLKKLESLGEALKAVDAEHSRQIHALVVQYDKLTPRVKKLEEQVQAHDLDIQNLKTRGSSGLTDGLALGIYGTGQIYRLYGEELYAGGGEVAFYPNVWNSRWRPAFGMGIGRAADYFGQTMVHLNLRGGLRRQAVFGEDWFSLAFGIEHNRYALNVFEEARGSYYGAFAEPRASVFVNNNPDAEVKGGDAVYFYARPGLGFRNGRHGKLPAGAPGAVTDHDFDISVTAGVGYEFITF